MKVVCGLYVYRYKLTTASLHIASHMYEGYITEEKVNSSKCTIHTCGAEARQGCVRVPWSAMRAHAAAAHAGRRSRALRARAIPSRMLRAPFITIALEIRCA